MGTIKCDGCGVVSINQYGAYKKPNLNIGFLKPKDFYLNDTKDDGSDWCEDCGKNLRH